MKRLTKDDVTVMAVKKGKKKGIAVIKQTAEDIKSIVPYIPEDKKELLLEDIYLLNKIVKPLILYNGVLHQTILKLSKKLKEYERSKI
ncbi:MAG: hypothetical protein DRN81_04885 [Thermoproteota archaeon]|nr:MAG: hypothetical protein DRN81_04885 [Candidatus Korarchaeota archaeon]